MFVCGACGQRYERGGFCSEDGQPLPETTDPLLGTEIGRYRLARMVGEGGMGQVYLAVQPAIGSRVAIKILSDQCARNPELLERFFAEAKAVNLVNHENIVSVIDLAQLPDGRPYIVMEFIEGATLAGFVRSGAAPLGGVVQVMTEVLSALAAAHAIGIVHRDLKPDNVIVTGEGHAKVLDFGIAKLAPGLSNALSPRTRTGALLGTPAYMAPEQISGAGNVDARTDIYAAGVVLFEAVTGAVPFRGDTLYDLMKAHLEVAPQRPSELRADLPRALEAVILQALAKDPKDRFQTAAAMSQALHHAANELPPDQWRALSSRGGMITGRPSMERSQQPTPIDPALAVTRVATPVPAPPTVRTRRTGRWIAVAAVVLMVGGVGMIVAGRTKSAGDEEPRRGASGSVDPLPVAPPPSPPPPVAGPAEVIAPATPVPATPTTPRTAPPATPRTAPPPLPPPATPPSPSTGSPTIIGGGSAIDHGVQIGSNVQIGTGVVIGGGTPPVPATASHFTRAIDYDPTKFDGTRYAPKAFALARSVFPDAGFVRYDVNYVFPSGLADLTKAEHSTSYIFRSPSHSARPPGLPANVAVKIECYVEVTIGIQEVSVDVRAMNPIDNDCKWPIRASLPRCSLAQVWAKAQANGAGADTVAKIAFLEDGQFFFDNEYEGSGFVKSYADACR